MSGKNKGAEICAAVKELQLEKHIKSIAEKKGLKPLGKKSRAKEIFEKELRRFGVTR